MDNVNVLILVIYYSFLREPFLFFYNNDYFLGDHSEIEFHHYKLNRKIFGRLKSGDCWKDNFETDVCEMFERRIENETNS
jgi:hypothetical protein